MCFSELVVSCALVPFLMQDVRMIAKMKTSIGALILLSMCACGVSVNLELSNQQQTDTQDEVVLYQDFEYNPLTMTWVLISTGKQCATPVYSDLETAIVALKSELGISALYQRMFGSFATSVCGNNSGEYYGAVVYQQEVYKLYQSGWLTFSEEEMDSFGIYPIN